MDWKSECRARLPIQFCISLVVSHYQATVTLSSVFKKERMNEHELLKTALNIYSCTVFNVFECVHVFFLRMDSDLEERWPIQGQICKAKVGLELAPTLYSYS